MKKLLTTWTDNNPYLDSSSSTLKPWFTTMLGKLSSNLDYMKHLHLLSNSFLPLIISSQMFFVRLNDWDFFQLVCCFNYLLNDLFYLFYVISLGGHPSDLVRPAYVLVIWTLKIKFPLTRIKDFVQDVVSPPPSYVCMEKCASPSFADFFWPALHTTWIAQLFPLAFPCCLESFAIFGLERVQRPSDMNKVATTSRMLAREQRAWGSQQEFSMSESESCESVNDRARRTRSGQSSEQ